MIDHKFKKRHNIAYLTVKRGAVVPDFQEKRSIGIDAMPQVCCAQIKQLGDYIKLARKRRRIRQEDMAERIAIAIKTYRKIEYGDPSVGIGLYLTALFMLGLNDDFSLLGAPERDYIGLSLENSRLPERVRTKQDKELDF
jgi:transcriptional regulator with XRE-family HTH domain